MSANSIYQVYFAYKFSEKLIIIIFNVGKLPPKNMQKRNLRYAVDNTQK